MKLFLIIFVAVVVVALILYFILFPRNTFISFNTASGGTVTFSRTSVSVEEAPEQYPTNGFDHIEPYVSRLLVTSKNFKSLNLFTPDGMRGFGFNARDGKIELSLTVEWKKELERETSIRSFFKALNIEPTQDYLANNGGIPDSTRLLTYPIEGNVSEVTALAKRILQELCGVSPTEALNIGYQDK